MTSWKRENNTARGEGADRCTPTGFSQHAPPSLSFRLGPSRKNQQNRPACRLGESEPRAGPVPDDLARELVPLREKAKARRHAGSPPLENLCVSSSILSQIVIALDEKSFYPHMVPLYPFPTLVQAAGHAQMLSLGTRENGY